MDGNLSASCNRYETRFVRVNDTFEVEAPNCTNVLRLTIRSSDQMFDPSFGVAQYGEQPPEVTEAPGIGPITYFSVTSSMDPDQISWTDIEFWVPREWFEATGTESGDLALHRWTGSDWELLETTVIGEENGRVMMSARARGFSVFAARPMAEATPGRTSRMTEAPTATPPVTTPTATLLDTTNPPTPGFGFIIGATGFLAVAYAVRRRRRRRGGE